MKNLILFLLFPLSTFAVTDNQLQSLKNDDIHLVAATCQENSNLRGCFKVDESTCLKQVKKSYDSCVKFVNKAAGSKLALQDFTKKLDSCVLRDVGNQWKEKSSDRSPACALPAKESL